MYLFLPSPNMKSVLILLSLFLGVLSEAMFTAALISSLVTLEGDVSLDADIFFALILCNLVRFEHPALILL